MKTTAKAFVEWGTALQGNRHIKCLRGIATIAIIAVLTLSTAQTPQGVPEAKLTAAMPVPVYAGGQQVGTVTLPAGAAVGILSSDGETTLAGTPFGQIPIPSASLAATGKSYTGEITFRADKVHKPTTAPTRPTGVQGFKGTPSGKEMVQAYPGLETQVLTLTNIERAKMGRKPLQWDENLARAARYHAQDMAGERYYNHDSHDRISGEIKLIADCFERIKQFAKNCGAENIAYGIPTPDHVVQVWMNSPGHKKNILNPELKTLGVGVCHGYWVQDFGW